MNSNHLIVFVVFTICTFLALSSCNDPNRDGSEIYSYTIQQKKQLAVDTTSISLGKDSSRTVLNISTQTGDNLVFKYRYNKMSPPNVADGGFSETVYFEIPASGTKANLQDSSLAKANVYYTRGCFCRRIGALEITDGTIKGEQLSPGKWYISASFNVDLPLTPTKSHSVSFRHLFRHK